MSKDKIFLTIAQVSLMIVGMIPIVLCFGFLADDSQRFVHTLLSVGIYGLLIGLISLVVAIMD